jgi:3-oxoacyl-[acyl-carrier-protein] synthase III
MAAFIKAISYYLPDFKLTNSLISNEFPEWGIEKISAKTGIDTRHISASDEFASDMALQAAEKLFQEHNIDRSSIDFLLLCTQSPDYFLPTTACILQHKLRLEKSVGALDFNLGCSGYVYGLSLAKGLIEGKMAKNVLLITSETYSKFIHPKDKSNRTIFGDAAAATLITVGSGVCQIGEFVFGTDGNGASNLIVKQGGMRFPINQHTQDVEDEFGNITNERNLYMNGSEIFNFTGQFVPQLTEQILAKAHLQKEQVGLYIFHQANKYMLNHLRKKMSIPEDQFYISMKHCGNTVSSTIPIALYEAIKEGRLSNIEQIILAGFGVGYSWAACNLTIPS